MMTIRDFWRQGAMRGIENAAARRSIAEARQRWLPILEAYVERDEDGVDEHVHAEIRRLRRLLGLPSVDRSIRLRGWWNGVASRSASGCDGSASGGRIRGQRPAAREIRGGRMSKLTRDDGQLLIHMISTWLTYTHLDEMDSDHIANAADLLHRAGVSSGEAEVFEICLPLHYDSRDASNAQHRVAIARFAEFRCIFPEDDGG